MKLTTLDEDLRIHQKLEDEPNDVGGLSAQALKEKFDQAGVTIQKYLNETHLPEEEQAVEDALNEAKAYTDAKAITLEQGNMKTAVYDAKKRRQDIFDYTDEKIAELKGAKASGAWICSGHCAIYSTGNLTTPLDEFSELTDPDELWSETEKAFTMPEGGRIALFWVHVRAARSGEARCYVRFLHNGVELTRHSLGYYTNGTWDYENIMIPVMVEAGDRISLAAMANCGPNNAGVAQAYIEGVSVIVFA